MYPTLPIAHILYENPDWLPPLIAGLEAEGFTVRTVALDEGLIDAGSVPAEGIWFNRISPSSHTRDHFGSVELTREVLYWLESHGRRVVNGLHAFEFEMSKFRQDLVLNRYGIRTPKTLLAMGKDSILEAARALEGPFITKHNQGGKGLGIQLFRSVEALEEALGQGKIAAGPGGKWILQEYIEAPGKFITRVEIVGDRFLFAMRSSTEQGFELCPSDACQLTDAGSVCPAEGPTSKFSPSPITAQDPLVQKYIRLCQNEGIDIAGIEFVEDAQGHRYTYDINGTTNYSGVLGDQIGVDGMLEVARWIRREIATTLRSQKAS